MSTTPCYPDQIANYHMIATSVTSEFADYSASVDHISEVPSLSIGLTMTS
jgi:hypothetical protein